MNFSGIIVGAATFLIIGVCHPIVIKMEYYWGKGSWWLFLLAGLAFVAASATGKHSASTTATASRSFIVAVLISMVLPSLFSPTFHG